MANKDYKRNRYLTKYGLTTETYDSLRKSQDYKCLLCGIHESLVIRKTEVIGKLHVDHCHITGKVRGLLCFNCNSLLGHCNDNISILKNAINYLERENNS